MESEVVQDINIDIDISSVIDRLDVLIEKMDILLSFLNSFGDAFKFLAGMVFFFFVWKIISLLYKFFGGVLFGGL